MYARAVLWRLVDVTVFREFRGSMYRSDSLGNRGDYYPLIRPESRREREKDASTILQVDGEINRTLLE